MEIIVFDKDPIIWKTMDYLWGEKLSVQLEYDSGSGYCCDVINSYNTTFSADSINKETIRLWGASGECVIVNKSIISKNTLSKVEKFEIQYGSVGNILPMPQDLNSPYTGRAGFKGMGDYFDNFLLYVKWLYSDDKHENKCIYSLNLTKKDEDYFSKFKNFDDYVESNLIQPFFLDSIYEYVKILDFRKFLCGEELINKFIDQSILIIKEREALILSMIKCNELKNSLSKYICKI